MTKKSKRRALKTGSRAVEEPRNTTVSCGINIKNADPNDEQRISSADEAEEDSDITNVKLAKKLTRGQCKVLKEQAKCELLALYQKENIKRHVYPIDLWFLLAQEIKPEQVKIFSLICKDAYHVITTRKFWLELYKRYATDHKTLPCHLTPKAITTTIGLKTRVIRSLFYCYPPYKEKLAHRSRMAVPLEQLEKKTCQCYWWRQETLCKRNTTAWVLHLKMVPPSILRHANTNIFKVTNLIRHNPEEQCCLLRVTSTSFVNIPDVSELHLTAIGVSVSKDMQHHRVKLTFHKHRRTNYGKERNAKTTTTTNAKPTAVVLIDPLLDLQLLSWWHPEYPHPLDN